MKISIKTFLPLSTVGIMSLASCQNTIKQRCYDYSFFKNKPYTDLVQIQKAENPSIQQAKLDSLAFREIFNSTMAVNDSAKIAEFEAIASSMQSTYNEIDRILTDEGITDAEYDLESFNLPDNKDDDQNYQYFADNWMYRKFLSKNGLMTDSIKNLCNIASILIKP